MKFKNIILSLNLLIFACSPIFVSAQILTLKEKRNNKTNLTVSNGGVVNVNGKLVLEINKANLVATLKSDNNAETLKLDELEHLKKWLDFQITEMSKAEDLNSFSKIMRKYLRVIDKNPVLKKYYREGAKAFSQEPISVRSNQNTADYISNYINIQIQNDLSKLESELKSELDLGSMKISIDGFISTQNGFRNVKLSDELDNLQGQFIEVPRWEVSLGEEGKKRLEDFGKLANTLNELSQTKVSDAIEKSKTILEADDCIKNLDNQLYTLYQILPSKSQDLQNKIKGLFDTPKADIENLLKKYAYPKSDFSGKTGTELLIAFDDDLNNTLNQLEEFVSTLDNSFKDIAVQIINDPEVKALKQIYDGCKSNIMTDITKVKRGIAGLKALSNSLIGNAMLANKVNDLVKKLTVSQLPKKVNINLKYTGERKNGDDLKIRINAHEEVNGRYNRRTLQVIFAELRLIGIYSVVKPTLIFANPFKDAKTSIPPQEFQFAPSYAILFKYGSRKFDFLNDFLQPAFGASFGAVDFDKDGTPEISAGIEISLFRDYFSYGINHNFGQNVGFYYIGFRVPLSSSSTFFNSVQTIP